MLQTNFAVYLGIVYTYLPFMILPLYANLVKLDESLLEASADLGGRPLATFFHVTLPLSMPGVIAGFMLVFVPAIGEFVIPELLGGPDTLMIGRVLWNEFFSNRDWPVASAVAIAMLVVLVVPIMHPARARRRRTEERLMRARRPLLLDLLHPRASSSSTRRSCRWSSSASTRASSSPSGAGSRPSGTASCCATRRSSAPPGSACRWRWSSATLAVVLGTLAAYVLTRFGRFRARALLTGMSTAPLVMPEVITGLSLLLLFVVDGAADRLAGAGAA